MTDRQRNRPIKSTLFYGAVVVIGLGTWALIGKGCVTVAQHVNLVSASCEDMTGVAQINCINQRVNARMKYRSDQDQYGVPDMWASSPASNQGDCEDYALTKADELERAGVNPKRMKLGFRTQTGGAHAFLVVDEMRADSQSPWLLAVPRDASLIPLAAARSFIGHGTNTAAMQLMAEDDDGAVW